MTEIDILRNKIERIHWVRDQYAQKLHTLESMTYQSDLTTIQIICYSAILTELDEILYDN